MARGRGRKPPRYSGATGSAGLGGGVKRPGSTRATTPKGSGKQIAAPLRHGAPGGSKAIAATSKDVSSLDGATGGKATSGRKIKY